MSISPLRPSIRRQTTRSARGLFRLRLARRWGLLAPQERPARPGRPVSAARRVSAARQGATGPRGPAGTGGGNGGGVSASLFEYEDAASLPADEALPVDVPFPTNRELGDIYRFAPLTGSYNGVAFTTTPTLEQLEATTDITVLDLSGGFTVHLFEDGGDIGYDVRQGGSVVDHSGALTAFQFPVKTALAVAVEDIAEFYGTQSIFGTVNPHGLGRTWHDK